MSSIDNIEDAIASAAIDIVLGLKNSAPGLGEYFPKHCQTAYTVGWLEALAASSKALREHFLERGEPRPELSTEIAKAALEAVSRFTTSSISSLPYAGPAAGRGKA